MRAYGERYLSDLQAFSKAYLLSLVTLVPLTLLEFSVLAAFVYLYLTVIGGVTIAVVSALSAVLASYAYKFAVYLLTVSVHGYYLWGVLSYRPAGGEPNINLLIFSQIVFLVALFYVLIERRKIWARLRARVEAER